MHLNKVTIKYIVIFAKRNLIIKNSINIIEIQISIRKILFNYKKSRNILNKIRAERQLLQLKIYVLACFEI